MLSGIKEGGKEKRSNIKSQPMTKSKSENKIGLLKDLKDNEHKFLNNRSSQKLLDISAQSPTKSANFSIINSNRDVLSMNKIKGRGELFP